MTLVEKSPIGQLEVTEKVKGRGICQSCQSSDKVVSEITAAVGRR